ncbi:MAG TPA: DNA recombination protein RmuC [Steroidobacteraceae bacterium]|nr:DNA recombination protein RmuC [Steroidobacteraceae bacterium]
MNWPLAVSALAGALIGVIVTLLIGRRLLRELLGREHASIDGAWRERERALQAVVEPLRSALHRTEKQVEALERDRRDAFTTLRTQIESLSRGQSLLQQETRNLVTALRRPEVRGRWGELTLRRVVELAGLSEHCDFIEQTSISAAQGVLRPDLVVQMPEGRQLVVDAKTPLDAYLDAIDASSEQARAQALNKHASQLEARVRDLAGKAYWAQFERCPEFAVLFLPGDQFLSSALSSRPDLLENAIRSNVIIATPSTLIALLKTIAYGWRQAAVAENAAQIRDLGQELHRRLASFVEHLDRSGRALSRAVESYNAAFGSLERQVLPSARRFTELGATCADPITAPEPIEELVRALSGERERHP